VGKVRFPREILPLASVGAGLVHFLLQSGVLLLSMLLFRIHVEPMAFLLIPPAIVTALVLASALAMLLSAVNVYARDTQHLLELVLLAWFWMTPILVPYEQIAIRLSDHGVPSWIFLLNPMTAVVLATQRALYVTTKTVVYARDAANHAIIVNGQPKIDHINHYLPDASLWWYARNLAIVLTVAFVILVLAIKVFDKAEGNFAEVM
jgi:ABC-2 type transport system permease protein